MCTPLSHGFLLALELQCSSNLVFEATVAPLRHDTPIEKPHVVICLTPVLNFIACFKIAPAGTVLKVGLSKFFFFGCHWPSLIWIRGGSGLVNRCAHARAGRWARDQLLGRARASISVGGGWDQSRGAKHYYRAPRRGVYWFASVQTKKNTDLPCASKLDKQTQYIIMCIYIVLPFKIILVVSIFYLYI